MEGTVKLAGNNVYVVPPNRRLLIADHVVSAQEFEEPRGQRAPIDLFFRSLAEHHNDGFAVILTGAGADGSVGVKAIKEAGGIVLVQDPNEAEYASMPRSAIATQMADFVLPVRELAGRLVELLGSRGLVPPTGVRENDEDSLRRILTHVRVRTGHDFSQYKRATVLRRIARRTQVTRKESLADYYAFLRENAEEAQSLFNDFLISVTTFFRDPQAFNSLARSVIPQLFEGKEAGGTIRVWVPGCATGEETYTIGILLLEEASRRDIRPEIQVFGSDLDAGALAIGREGRYPASIEADLNEERLRRFFQREGDHYRVRRELRDIVLFASHSLLRDPPFSRLDLISCRNLLIYLDWDLQQQVCNTFHYALHPHGFLFLGSSESADHPVGMFGRSTAMPASTGPSPARPSAGRRCPSWWGRTTPWTAARPSPAPRCRAAASATRRCTGRCWSRSRLRACWSTSRTVPSISPTAPAAFSSRPAGRSAPMPPTWSGRSCASTCAPPCTGPSSAASRPSACPYWCASTDRRTGSSCM